MTCLAAVVFVAGNNLHVADFGNLGRLAEIVERVGRLDMAGKHEICAVGFSGMFELYGFDAHYSCPVIQVIHLSDPGEGTGGVIVKSGGVFAMFEIIYAEEIFNHTVDRKSGVALHEAVVCAVKVRNVFGMYIGVAEHCVVGKEVAFDHCVVQQTVEEHHALFTSTHAAETGCLVYAVLGYIICKSELIEERVGASEIFEGGIGLVGVGEDMGHKNRHGTFGRGIADLGIIVEVVEQPTQMPFGHTLLGRVELGADTAVCVVIFIGVHDFGCTIEVVSGGVGHGHLTEQGRLPIVPACEAFACARVWRRRS